MSSLLKEIRCSRIDCSRYAIYGMWRQAKRLNGANLSYLLCVLLANFNNLLVYRHDHHDHHYHKVTLCYDTKSNKLFVSHLNVRPHLHNRHNRSDKSHLLNNIWLSGVKNVCMSTQKHGELHIHNMYKFDR